MQILQTLVDHLDRESQTSRRDEAGNFLLQIPVTDQGVKALQTVGQGMLGEFQVGPRFTGRCLQTVFQAPLTNQVHQGLKGDKIPQATHVNPVAIGVTDGRRRTYHHQEAWVKTAQN